MFTLLGIPSDENSSFMKGTAKAPELIRRALYSESSNLWTESGVDLGSVDLVDKGDLNFEPGGLTTRQAIRLIQSLTAPRIVGCDIVEYNPDRDPSGVTAMCCAKILKEITGKIQVIQKGKI